MDFAYRKPSTEPVDRNQPVEAHKPRFETVLVSSAGLKPLRLNSQGDDFLKETHFLRRGNPNQKLRIVLSMLNANTNKIESIHPSFNNSLASIRLVGCAIINAKASSSRFPNSILTHKRSIKLTFEMRTGWPYQSWTSTIYSASCTKQRRQSLLKLQLECYQQIPEFLAVPSMTAMRR